MIKTGKKVPALSGLIQDGTQLALADLRGQSVVVYFYPKDNTTGCTREAQDFRDLYKAFRRAKCEIIGVSRDSVRSHTNFRTKHELPYPLIADVDETWCKAFDVIHEKVLYGRKYLGIVRSTFLIGPDGTLVEQWLGVKVPGHAQAVLDRLTTR